MTTEVDRIEQVLETFWADAKQDQPKKYPKWKPDRFRKAQAAIHKELTKARLMELESLLEGITVPEGHFGILSGSKIRGYVVDRIDHLKREAGGENE